MVIIASNSINAQDLEQASLFDFTEAKSSQLYKFDQQPGLVSHAINVNSKVKALSANSSLILPLPDGNTIELTITKKQQAQNGDILLNAKFGENDQGSAVITLGKDVTFANISSPDHSYTISVDANKQAILVDNKLSKFDVNLQNDMVFSPNFEPMAHLKDAPKSALKKSQSANMSGNNEVTILILYSDEFANGFTDPLARINQMIAFTNSAYARSGINIDLKLAHAQQLSFSNGTSPGTLLSQVRTAVGAFSVVPGLRDQYYADMVAVLPFVSGGGVSGIAYVNGNNPNYSYSVTQFAVWGSDSVFAHELGHNLGSGHERLSANPSQGDPCSGGYTGYSCGHGSGSNGTIMSYLNDSPWGFVFSNPQLDCNGTPCGIASGNSNSADNKTSFNITAPLVEAFRVDTSNDDDKDGVDNQIDNCPLVKNSNQRDTDSDQQGDACDDDDDNDTINDTLDNCPLVANQDQLDSDMNGIGDVCQQEEMCFPVKNKNEKTALICL